MWTSHRSPRAQFPDGPGKEEPASALYFDSGFGRDGGLVHHGTSGRGKQFISIEEFSAACPKVSKTHIEQLKAAGGLWTACRIPARLRCFDGRHAVLRRAGGVQGFCTAKPLLWGGFRSPGRGRKTGPRKRRRRLPGHTGCRTGLPGTAKCAMLPESVSGRARGANAPVPFPLTKAAGRRQGGAPAPEGRKFIRPCRKRTAIA